MARAVRCWSEAMNGTPSHYIVNYNNDGLPNAFPHPCRDLQEALDHASKLINAPARPRGMRIWIDGPNGEHFEENDIRQLLAAR